MSGNFGKTAQLFLDSNVDYYLVNRFIMDTNNLLEITIDPKHDCSPATQDAVKSVRRRFPILEDFPPSTTRSFLKVTEAFLAISDEGSAGSRNLRSLIMTLEALAEGKSPRTFVADPHSRSVIRIGDFVRNADLILEAADHSLTRARDRAEVHYATSETGKTSYDKLWAFRFEEWKCVGDRILYLRNKYNYIFNEHNASRRV